MVVTAQKNAIRGARHLPSLQIRGRIFLR